MAITKNALALLLDSGDAELLKMSLRAIDGIFDEYMYVGTVIFVCWLGWWIWLVYGVIYESQWRRKNDSNN